MRTLYRRVRVAAIRRRPQLTARGDPAHDHVVAQMVARLIDLPRRAVVLAEDETHLHLLPHIRASWTPRGTRPHIRTPDKNRQVTVFGAIDVSTGAWVYRLGRRLHGGVAQGSGDCSGGQVRRVSSIGLISPTSLPSGSATIAYRAPQKASNGGWRPT